MVLGKIIMVMVKVVRIQEMNYADFMDMSLRIDMVMKNLKENIN